MTPDHSRRREVLRGSRLILAWAAIMQNGLAPVAFAAQPSDSNTVTPIKHVIVIVGENRTFDHLFATYQPVSGETVNNLLSEKIVKADGSPGSNYAQAQQYTASVTSTYEISPSPKTLFKNLPAQLNGGPSNVCQNNGMCNYGDARSSEDTNSGIDSKDRIVKKREFDAHRGQRKGMAQGNQLARALGRHDSGETCDLKHVAFGHRPVSNER